MFRPLPSWRSRFALPLGLATLAAAAGLMPVSPAAAATAASKPDAKTAAPAVEEHILGNGMKVLLVPRHLSPTVSCGWVAHVGSANERPGITGIAHLFEHMMFKGTHVIGTRDYALDAKLIQEQEAVMEDMRAEISKLRAAYRRGDIDDITKPEAKTPRMKALEVQFDSLVAKQRQNMIKNEFDLVIQNNGGSRINAFTNEDMTFYFYTLPANKLELYFWMEADRLKNRVFREFYSERDVVYEERRRSLESTPTGKFEESFNSTFWDASPVLVGHHRLAERRGEHHAGAGGRLLRPILRAAEPDRGRGRRLRPQAGPGARGALLRLHPARHESHPRDDHHGSARRRREALLR